MLAGGVGARFGRSKGDLVAGGTTLAERAARALEPLCAGVIVSLRPGTHNPAPGRAALEDAPPAGRGPLAGILAVLEATARRDLLVLACDYPRVATAHLQRLLTAAQPSDDVVVAVDAGGRDHPLVALWRRGTEACVRRALEAGRYRVADVVRALAARRVGVAPEGGVLLNVNRPEDLPG